MLSRSFEKQIQVQARKEAHEYDSFKKNIFHLNKWEYIKELRQEKQIEVEEFKEQTKKRHIMGKSV